MQASELLEKLQDSGIPTVDNQDIASSISKGIDTCALCGDTMGKDSFITGELAGQLPEPEVTTQPEEQAPSYTSTFDIPGLS